MDFELKSCLLPLQMKKLYPVSASAFEIKQYLERRLCIFMSASGQYKTPEHAVL